METLTKLEEQPKPNKNTHAAVIHLSALSSYLGVPLGSIFGPLIFWLIWKGDSKLVDENGKEALNFNLSLLLYKLVAIIIGVLMFLGPILSMAASENPNPWTMIFSIPGIWLFAGTFGLIGIYRLVMVIIAAIKASNGEVFHYPLTIRLIK